MRRWGMLVMLVVLMVVFAFPAQAKKKKDVRVYGGMVINPYGIAVDASYDRRLDNLVPGYKVVDVVIINDSLQVVYLNPEKDKWWVKLAENKRPIKAIHDLRRADSKSWSHIPERARGLLSYPLVIPIGARQVIDLFVPDTVDLDRLQELIIQLKSAGGPKFEIMLRQ